MKKTLLLVLMIALSFSACEKDDICDANTPTTPRLVIKFYDVANPTVLKTVTSLKVIGEGMADGIIFNPSATGDSKYTTSANTISISLKTDVDITAYRFILNSGNPNLALVNEDRIQFDYTRENLFVSRACGYKTVYTLDPIKPYTLSDAAAADQKWIQAITVEKNNIDNENETHLKIYF